MRRRICITRVSIALAALAVVAMPAAAHAAAAPVAQLPALGGLAFGVDDDWAQTRVPLATQVKLATSLYPVSDANRVARLFACWCEMETPGQGHTFTRIQSAYDALVRAGIHPIISVSGSPYQWSAGACNANTAPCFARPVGHDREWSDFWSDLAYNFPDAILEVWNEPNLSRFWKQAGGGVDPEDYARLLNLAYTAIKRARPATQVLAPSLAATGSPDVGGLADDAFLKRFFAADPHFDGLSIKPFAGPAEPWTFNVRAKVKRVEAQRDAAGFGAKKIWIVNTGLSTGGDPQHATPTEAQQGIGLASDYRALAADPDIAAIIVFRLVDTLNSDPWEAHLGLWKYNTADPSAPVEKSNTQKLRDAIAAGPYPAPTVSISTTTPTVGVGQAATFKATGFPSYPGALGNPVFQWDTDGNGQPEPSTAGTKSTAQRKYTKAGTYKVTVTASDTLEEASASLTVTVQSAPVSGIDKTAPKISALRASPFAFHAATAGSSIAAVRTGTTIRFTSSEQAVTTRFTFQRVYPGRLVGKTCHRQTSANRRGHKTCSYYAALAGYVNRYTKQGANHFRFTGRLHGHTLAKARYRITAQATDVSKNRGTATHTFMKVD
jgi:hypothetical protein